MVAIIMFSYTIITIIMKNAIISIMIIMIIMLIMMMTITMITIFIMTSIFSNMTPNMRIYMIVNVGPKFSDLPFF